MEEGEVPTWCFPFSPAPSAAAPGEEGGGRRNLSRSVSPPQDPAICSSGVEAVVEAAVEEEDVVVGEEGQRDCKRAALECGGGGRKGLLQRLGQREEG